MFILCGSKVVVVVTVIAILGLFLVTDNVNCRSGEADDQNQLASEHSSYNTDLMFLSCGVHTCTCISGRQLSAKYCHCIILVSVILLCIARAHRKPSHYACSKYKYSILKKLKSELSHGVI